MLLLSPNEVVIKLVDDISNENIFQLHKVQNYRNIMNIIF